MPDGRAGRQGASVGERPRQPSAAPEGASSCSSVHNIPYPFPSSCSSGVPWCQAEYSEQKCKRGCYGRGKMCFRSDCCTCCRPGSVARAGSPEVLASCVGAAILLSCGYLVLWCALDASPYGVSKYLLLLQLGAFLHILSTAIVVFSLLYLFFSREDLS
jgi:hypothetical protein